VHSYDPYRSGKSGLPKGPFGLILMIEVIEHVTDLKILGQHMKNLLSKDGLIWIETSLTPMPVPADILDSWYVSPRNGHVSIFSLMALTLFFRQYGINIVMTPVVKLGFKSLPRFPNKFFV